MTFASLCLRPNSAVCENESALAFAAGHGLGGGPDILGIGDGLLAVGTAILHLVPQRKEQRFHFLFIEETGVIGTEGNFHGKEKSILQLGNGVNPSEEFLF
jgi:hypothetical protein